MINPKLAELLRQEQESWDIANAEETEAQDAAPSIDEQVKGRVRLVRHLADTKAIFVGGHVYLGRDALVKEYLSGWLPAKQLSDTPNTILEVKMTKTSDINRANGIETGTTFRDVTFDMRLYDIVRDVTSPVDRNVLVFSSRGITIKKNEELLPVVPGDENWDEIGDMLETLVSERLQRSVLQEFPE